MKNKLIRHRQIIDKIDRNIVTLLHKRALIVKKIGVIKKTEGGAIYDPAREGRIFEKLKKGAFPAAELKIVFKKIFSASRAIQRKVIIKSKRRRM